MTAFVAAGGVLRWAGGEHRAMVEPDPYGDAYTPVGSGAEHLAVGRRDLVGHHPEREVLGMPRA